MRRFEAGGSKIHEITSIVDHLAFVIAEVADVVEIAPNDGSSIHQEPGEIVEPDEVVKDDEKDRDL